MAEPDHVFVRPLPNLARDDYPAGFPFFYIKPAEHSQIIRKFFPKEKGPVTNIDPIGNSPVIIKKVYFEFLIFDWLLQHVCTFKVAKYVSFYSSYFFNSISLTSLRLYRILSYLMLLSFI